MPVFNAKSIDVERFEDLQSLLGAFRHSMNKGISIEDFQSVISENPIPAFELNALKMSYSAEPQRPELGIDHLYAYDTLLRSQIATPAKWGLIPVIDSINFTAPASKKELRRIHELLDGNNLEDYGLHAVMDTGNHKAYKAEAKVRNYYLRTYRIRLLNADGSKSEPVYFSYGSKIAARKSKRKALRFSFNPARFNEGQINDIFSNLNDTGVFQDLELTLDAANVTRVDLALDFIGIPAPMLCVAQSNVRKYFALPKDPEDGIGQTFYIGTRNKTRVVIYNKIAKQLSKRQRHVAGLAGPNSNPFELVRLEWVMMPQGNNGKELKLRDLNTLSSLFRAKTFYSPLIYLEYPTCHTDFLKKGVIKTLMSESKKLKKNGKPMTKEMLKKKPKLSKTMRNGQIKAMFNNIEKFKMHINQTWFKKEQKKVLNQLVSEIFTFER
ncbi:replication initiation factor domain-containing protein [Alishewanella sp. 16-MA]|uniref:Replication initiation factor domain-containing protein n=1 Tax=Alishewanella maricola TaxID=2795740 RepID=A0ABS8C5W9_9ALTE|nr:replication initiation factor domain-containing protein [Alishewanella maricola]MCB5227718.1 replication initiation factor domain-containing protein [Alishewanella maricola]